MSEKVSSLLELTKGQESGIVVYGNGEAIVCNWASIEGLPHVLIFSGVSSLGVVLGLNEEIERVEGINGRIEDYVNKEQVISNDNDDELVGEAVIYKLPGDIIVIAPKGWN